MPHARTTTARPQGCRAHPPQPARTLENKRRQTRRQCARQRLHARSSDAVVCRAASSPTRFAMRPRTIARSSLPITCCAAPGPNPPPQSRTHAHRTARPPRSRAHPPQQARTAEIKRRQTRRQCAHQRLHASISDFVVCRAASGPTLRTKPRRMGRAAALRRAKADGWARLSTVQCDRAQAGHGKHASQRRRRGISDAVSCKCQSTVRTDEPSATPVSDGLDGIVSHRTRACSSRAG